MIKVCLAGLGRTGREIAREILEQKDMKLVSVLCSPESDKRGRDIAEYLKCHPTGIIIESSANIEQVIFRTKPDVVIDFSTPFAALRNARILSRMRVNMIIGTTGFSKVSLKKLRVLSRKYNTGILYAPNITLGVNVLMLLTQLAARILGGYDFQIMEMHHKNKMDIPSGTALKLAGEIKQGLVYSDDGGGGKGEIPISSVRAGGVISRHEVIVIGEDDRIEIAHESFSRKTFAQGALKAVRYVYKKSGFLEMRDVLNLQKVLSDYLESEGIPAVSLKDNLAF